MQLPFLRFEPLLKHYLWGGERLQTRLGKTVPKGKTCAESWEIVDRPEHQSVAMDGPFAGKTIHQIANEFPECLYGHAGPFPPRFPLLLKFLDAQLDLSVQVHPNDAQAAQLTPPDLGKTEAWYVLEADKRSRIFAGLAAGIDEAALRAALAAQNSERCIHVFESQSHDCVFVPAGAVHALGAGNLIAEIQQASDTTFRLHDWNRVGPDGKPRELHVESAMRVIDFAAGPILPIRSKLDETGRATLVDCDKFRWDRVRTSTPLPLGGDGRCHVFASVEGSAQLLGEHGSWQIRPGSSWLAPASSSPAQFVPSGICTLLDATLPVPAVAAS